MCLLAAHLLQCRSSLCFYPESELLLSCFCIAALWLRWFLWIGCKRVFVIGSCITFTIFRIILVILFPQVYSLFLAGSFQFSFHRALPSSHFVYHLPCYPRLSIFNQDSNLIDLILHVFCLFF